MNILLIDDHPIFRFGVATLIRQRWPETHIGEAGSLVEALALARKDIWTVALVDLNLPDAQGIEGVARIHREFPGLPLLVLSLNDEAAYAQRTMQAGAAGYLPKDRASSDLIVALERVASGKRYISAAQAERLADQLSGQQTAVPHEALSAQEYRVLLHLAEGLGPTDIAERMTLSPKTVSTYRTRILEKLGVASNAELARYCISHGLITE